MFAVLALLGSPATAWAEDPAPLPLDPIEAPGDPTVSAVSPPASDSASALMPLTRAATRERINGMSPVDWLASYGEVVVGRTAPVAPTSPR